MSRKRSSSRRENLPSFGRQVIGGLRELRDAIEQGQPMESRFTVRHVNVDISPPAYRARDIQAIRKRLNVSQAMFARLLAVSVKTVQAWERGNRPTPMACRLLEAVNRDPAGWLEMLEGSRRRKIA